jgi:hypothetical protein
MATSFTDKASARMEAAEADVREALAGGDGNAALVAAVRALRAEAAKVRRRRPGDAGLIDAELAGNLLSIAARLPTYKPVRRGAYSRVPRPSDLLDAFGAALAIASRDGDSQ